MKLIDDINIGQCSSLYMDMDRENTTEKSMIYLKQHVEIVYKINSYYSQPLGKLTSATNDYISTK